MSWLSKKTGRPREKGGHTRRNISVDEFTTQGLNKVKGGKKNVSRFVESALQPILKELDPPNAELPTEITGLDWLRIADRTFAEENNLPRLMHPEDTLPTFLVEGKFTGNPLFDLLPAVVTRHQREPCS